MSTPFLSQIWTLRQIGFGLSAAKGDESKLLNPKCAILQESYQDTAKVCKFKVSEPSRTSHLTGF